MKDTAALALKDYIALALAGIGISFPMHQFFGGLILAIAGASFARTFMPEKDEREFWVMVLGAALAAIIAAELVNRYWPDFPIQLAMCASGFFSRYLARISLRAAGLLETKVPRIIDGGIEHYLPLSPKDKDE